VIGYRTKDAKLGAYSYFAPGSIDIMMSGQEVELYDYQADGIGEVKNRAPGTTEPNQALYDQLYTALFDEQTGAVPTELRQPLPLYLQKAQQEAMTAYLAHEAWVNAKNFSYLPSIEK
jgi:hypothetical protein